MAAVKSNNKTINKLKYDKDFYKDKKAPEYRVFYDQNDQII